MTARPYSLDDKYLLEEGVVYLSGVQALARLPLEQMRRDRRAGLRTGCFISGYEGSPLGGYDLALERISKLLEEHNVRFLPGVNEDLAVTAVMGSQLIETMPQPNVDGVVGIWYGKGPGVDRSGDALRHANLAGTGRHCGALALAGDDHISKSSTIPHQSEISLYNFGIPVLSPSSVQEVLDFGLYGIALSRFSGAWCGIKLATDVCDGGASIEVSPERCRIVVPEFLVDGAPYEKKRSAMLLIPMSLELEREMLTHRLEAARLFARENGLNRIVVRGPNDRLGIVAVGKAYADLRGALAELGYDDAGLRAVGVRLLKLGMAYPLEPSIIDEFVDGLEEVVVAEEKRSFVELLLRELLYNSDRRPKIYGKTGPDGEALLPADGELSADRVARALGRWLGDAPAAAARLERITEIETRFAEAGERPPPPRWPTFCSGCPHNRSTITLEGQIAGGGIGCHAMAAGLQDPGRSVAYMTQMGSEGAAWIGMAPFTGKGHIFQNIGDGTYFHSGRQAVHAAIAAGVNVTFKLLYNSAVAMTGGQDAAGAIAVPALTRELAAAGVRHIVVLADDPRKYDERAVFAAEAEVRPREALEETLRELEAFSGVSVLIYDQMCAAEQRRRRNRGKLPQPERRLIINERVCEGCGDCVTQSNCVSLRAVETEWGARTRIHQSSCNTDYSCLLGDCPSFASVYIEPGTGLKRQAGIEAAPPAVPEPASKPALESPFHVLMPGVGGTGVVTLSAMLATAAVIEGKCVVSLDQTGLAQKGGAVVSHLTLSAQPIESGQRISRGQADLLLGFDPTISATRAHIARLHPERTRGAVNADATPSAAAMRQGLTVLSTESHAAALLGRACREDLLFLPASRLSEKLFGSHLPTNLLVLGAAYQLGALPLAAESIEEAIQLNGVSVESNLVAFRWGRAVVADPSRIESLLEETAHKQAESLDERIERYRCELIAYQDEVYAARFNELVTEVRRAEEAADASSQKLTRSVADNLFKLMAYKDEYEVARLLLDPAFKRQVAETFDKPIRMVYHLHPPVLRTLGMKRKLSLGGWIRPVLRMLYRMRSLRGSAFDPFGRTSMRRAERELIEWYEGVVSALLGGLTKGNLGEAFEIAVLPDGIRGYEEVKFASADAVKSKAAERLERYARRSAA